MLKTFIEKIESMALKGAGIVEVDGRKLCAVPMNPIRQSMPDALKVRTLQGVINYIATTNREDDQDNLVINVESYNMVRLCSKLVGAEQQRAEFCRAEPFEVKHQFGMNLPLDQFLVYVQSCFVQDGNTAKILRTLGNVVVGATAEYSDDGVTQHVTARTGITRKEVVDLPNPVPLRPYRIFAELEQPESLFVLRVQMEEGKAPSASLTEADGGAWKNQAIASIKEFFAGSGMYVIG